MEGRAAFEMTGDEKGPGGVEPVQAALDSEIRIWGLRGLPEIAAGDDLGSLIVDAVRKCGRKIGDGDVVVVAQKIVSKAEGRTVHLNTVEPSAESLRWAAEWQKDARVVEVVRRETRRVVRKERGVLIVETHQGFICANAGVDTSNNAPDVVTLLPADPDASAQRMRADFERAWGVRVGVIVSDTFGRPWREGLVNVALGVAGLAPMLDYRGQQDAQGRTLNATMMAVADELASAAELVMGKMARVPVALVHGFSREGAACEAGTSGQDLLRPAKLDLFR